MLNVPSEVLGNSIPADVRKIHMIAACGTGMGALACMLQEMGFEVTGSDRSVYRLKAYVISKRAEGFPHPAGLQKLQAR